MAKDVYRHDGSRDVTQDGPDDDWNDMLDLVSSITEGHTHDGADSKSISADHITNGSTNATITLTQETNFETGYTHSQDESQAHPDYLRNNANDAGKSLVLTDASDIPLVLNNSTGTQNIFEVKDNGNTVFHIKDGGVMEFMDGTDGSPASIGAIFRLDNQLTGVGKRFFAVKLVQEGVVTSGTTNTGNYNLTVDSASTGTTFQAFNAFMQTRHADANLPYAHAGFYEIKGTLGHMQEANALRTRLVIVDGTIDDLTGLRINDVIKTGSGSVTNLYGIYIEKLTEGSTNCAIVLNGDGVGSDITFGAGQDDNIYHDGTDLVLDVANGIKLGNSATNYTHISNTGDVVFVGSGGLAFGGISAYNVGENVDMSDGSGIGNKEQIAAFNTNSASNNTTPDHTNDHMTITKAGAYFCMVSIHADSQSGSAARFGFGVFKNNGNTQFSNVHGHIDMPAGAGGNSRAVPMSGIIEVAVNDTVEVWAWNEDNTQNVTVDDITLSLVQIGGT